jgi:pimeloyl-ACP methyl ester carboxylesterase
VKLAPAFCGLGLTIVAKVRIAVGDVRLFVEVLGQEWAFDGERRLVLVGLHGGPGLDGTKLRYQLAPLADIAQVIVPDQRGHGRSDYGTPQTWRLASWAEDVKNLCEVLGIEQPVVLGISFGGSVAQHYAVTYPDHPAGLILVSTVPRLPSSEELVARFREVGGDVAADVMRRDAESPTKETLAEWMRVCHPLLSRHGGSDPLLAELEAARIQTIDVNLHFMSGQGKETDHRSELAGVRCPTLVLVGEHDPLVPIPLAREIVEAIPDGLAQLNVVPDAAHDVFADNPKHTYPRIRHFLASLEYPSRPQGEKPLNAST